MNVSSEYFFISRQVRYYSIGCPIECAQTIWVVLHGYGQLADRFLLKFKGIAERELTAIVAPEAPSKFYLDSNFNKVGASWMTRENRLQEIEEQFDLLENLFTIINTKNTHENRKTIALGFSQGVPTLWRWIEKSKVDISALVLWAGLLPDEPVPNIKERIQSIPLFVVRGNEDAIIDTHKKETSHLILNNNEVSYQELSFVGGHEIHTETLLHISKVMNYEIKPIISQIESSQKK